MFRASGFRQLRTGERRLLTPNCGHYENLATLRDGQIDAAHARKSCESNCIPARYLGRKTLDSATSLCRIAGDVAIWRGRLHCAHLVRSLDVVSVVGSEVLSHWSCGVYPKIHGATHNGLVGIHGISDLRGDRSDPH